MVALVDITVTDPRVHVRWQETIPDGERLRLQERYGWEKERTKQELDNWRRDRGAGV